MSQRFLIIIALVSVFLTECTAQKTNGSSSKNVSSKQWTYDMYKTVGHTNFRKNVLFQQSFSSSKPDIPLLNAALFFMTNEQRQLAGVYLLDYHPACEIAAFQHSKSMVEKDFFSHTNYKQSDRSSTVLRAMLAGITNPSIAENIAYNYTSGSTTYLDVADKLITQWMNSSGHRSNILSKQAHQLGCGVYFSGSVVYATQVYQWFNELKSDNPKDKLPNLLNGTAPVVKFKDFE